MAYIYTVDGLLQKGDNIIIIIINNDMCGYIYKLYIVLLTLLASQGHEHCTDILIVVSPKPMNNTCTLCTDCESILSQKDGKASIVNSYMTEFGNITFSHVSGLVLDTLPAPLIKIIIIIIILYNYLV